MFISFRIDWFDLLAVQGTLKSLLQHQGSKTSILFSLLYGPTLTSVNNYWKNHSFTEQMLVGFAKNLSKHTLSEWL